MEIKTRYNIAVNMIVAKQALPSGQILQLVQGDITAETTDAIVNAANEYLRHGAGVAGAVVRKGGAEIQRESDEWIRKHGRLSHAAPAWTSGGNLPCKYVIHAVGPVWGTGDEEAKLSAAIAGSLKVADELGLESISFPAISTGIFGFPKELAAQVILAAVRDHFTRNVSKINLIRLVIYDTATLTAFQKAWSNFPKS